MFLNYLKTNESSLPVQLKRSTAELDEVGNEQVFYCTFKLLFFYGNFLESRTIEHRLLVFILHMQFMCT